MPVLLQFAQKNDQLELMTGFAFKSTPASLRRSSADAAAKQTGDMHNPCKANMGRGLKIHIHILYVPYVLYVIPFNFCIKIVYKIAEKGHK